MSGSILETIHTSLDVKRLTLAQQQELCSELRGRILSTVSRNGGHLASNLGAVELTVALHACFEPPIDRLVFDVGHQCYAHKLLTGRQKAFDTLRQFGGLSGFPRPQESPCDAFHSGHSSTAISAATGIATGLRLSGSPGYTVAVVGDGAMTGGLSFEGLNNAAQAGRLIVVLNDNDISISKNVGSLARYLSAMTSNPLYFKLKDNTRRIVQEVPVVGQPVYRMVSAGKRMAKDALTASNLFESFGFDYYGPIDGHDIKTMTDVFWRARSLGRPALVHVKTVKGKGVPYAQQNPSLYHGVSPFDAKTGEIPAHAPSFCDVFGKKMLELAAKDDKIAAITAAMTDGVGLSDFSKAYPDRFFDVGIAEQHAVTFAAGLATTGCRPVVAVYSTFLQRAYDQIVHDVALPGLPVVLAVDRAGIVGEDGATHQGLFDAAFLSSVPNMTVYSPADYEGLERCLERALSADTPQAVRYPRGEQPILPEGRRLPDMTVYDGYQEDAGGQGQAPQLSIVTYGRITAACLQAARALGERGVRVRVVSLERICPIDYDELIPEISGRVLFVEEGIEAGGIGQQCLFSLFQRGACERAELAAVKGRFVPHGTTQQLLSLCGLDAAGIEARAQELLQQGEEHE